MSPSLGRSLRPIQGLREPQIPLILAASACQDFIPGEAGRHHHGRGGGINQSPKTTQAEVKQQLIRMRPRTCLIHRYARSTGRSRPSQHPTACTRPEAFRRHAARLLRRGALLQHRDQVRHPSSAKGRSEGLDTQSRVTVEPPIARLAADSHNSAKTHSATLRESYLRLLDSDQLRRAIGAPRPMREGISPIRIAAQQASPQEHP